MPNRTRKPKPKATKTNVPTACFIEMKQTWDRVVRALYKDKDGMDRIATSIEQRLRGKRLTDFVEIKIPLNLVQLIASACFNHNVGVGRKFALVASRHTFKPAETKPVPSGVMAEAVECAKEELAKLEAMETE